MLVPKFSVFELGVKGKQVQLIGQAGLKLVSVFG